MESNKLKLIIAEDEADMLRLLIRQLSGRFEIIATVKDGRYLVDAAALFRPDVIVSDVLMPRLTGPQAMQELKARGHEFPFVFISASTELVREGTYSIVHKLDIFSELEPAVHAAALGTVYVSQNAR